VRYSVEKFTSGGTTVNLCALDFSKAFDKLNHWTICKTYAFIFPIVLFEVLEDLFTKCLTCVRFGSAMSDYVNLKEV
jgi:hypothetical protein